MEISLKWCQEGYSLGISELTLHSFDYRVYLPSFQLSVAERGEGRGRTTLHLCSNASSRARP